MLDKEDCSRYAKSYSELCYFFYKLLTKYFIWFYSLSPELKNVTEIAQNINMIFMSVIVFNA